MKEEIGKDITVTYVIESLKAKRLFLKQQLFWIFLYFMQVYKFWRKHIYLNIGSGIYLPTKAVGPKCYYIASQTNELVTTSKQLSSRRTVPRNQRSRLERKDSPGSWSKNTHLKYLVHFKCTTNSVAFATSFWQHLYMHGGRNKINRQRKCIFV